LHKDDRFLLPEKGGYSGRDYKIRAKKARKREIVVLEGKRIGDMDTRENRARHKKGFGL